MLALFQRKAVLGKHLHAYC